LLLRSASFYLCLSHTPTLLPLLPLPAAMPAGALRAQNLSKAEPVGRGLQGRHNQ